MKFQRQRSPSKKLIIKFPNVQHNSEQSYLHLINIILCTSLEENHKSTGIIKAN